MLTLTVSNVCNVWCLMRCDRVLHVDVHNRRQFMHILCVHFGIWMLPIFFLCYYFFAIFVHAAHYTSVFFSISSSVVYSVWCYCCFVLHHVHHHHIIAESDCVSACFFSSLELWLFSLLLHVVSLDLLTWAIDLMPTTKLKTADSEQRLSGRERQRERKGMPSRKHHRQCETRNNMQISFTSLRVFELSAAAVRYKVLFERCSFVCTVLPSISSSLSRRWMLLLLGADAAATATSLHFSVGGATCQLQRNQTQKICFYFLSPMRSYGRDRNRRRKNNKY